jgi:hypothetical protein
VIYKSGYFESMNPPGKDGNYQMPPQVAALMQQSMQIVVAHGKVISLIIIVPTLGFLSWLFFRKSKYNYAENLVLQALMMGQMHLYMMVIFIPLFLLLGYARLNNTVYQLTVFVYMAVAYQQFFKNHIVVTLLKTVLIQFLFIVLFWVFIYSFVLVRNQLL